MHSHGRGVDSCRSRVTPLWLIRMDPLGSQRANGSRRAVTRLMLLCLLELLTASGGSSAAPGLELFPKHFLLKPGERIHYQVMERSEGGQLRFTDAKFTIDKPRIVRLREESA